MFGLPGFGRKAAIKPVLQAEANECGLACLAMIANYHGHEVGLSYLRSLFELSHEGMNLAEIVDLAGQFGLDVQGLAVSSAAELASVKCPALLHWNGNHFVVLEKVARGQFHVQDPAFGLRVYSAEDMERHFSGVALEFEPRVRFEKIRQQKKSTFWSVFRSCRGIEHTIAIVSVMSFAANLFALASPIFLQVALDNVIPQYDLDLLTVVAAGMALFAVFEALSRWMRDLVILRSSTLFELFFTRNLVGHALRLPLKYFELRHAGDFITRMSSVDQIKTFLVSGFVSSVADGAMSFLMVVMMFYYSPVMALASVSTLAVAIVIRMVTYPKVARFTTEVLEARSEEQTRLIDGIKSVASYKAHNSSDYFCLRWFDSFSRFANAGFKTKKLTIDTDLLLHVVFMFGTVATLYVGVTAVMKSEASIGVLYAFFALRNSFFQNMNQLILNLVQLSIMRTHFERLDDVMCESAEPGSDGIHVERAVRSDVRFEDLAIQFGAGAKPLLENVNLRLDVARHETIAITGESGCGKSSLLKVMSSLHQPSAGAVLVDGQSLDQFGLHEYRANIGAVFAEDTLFAGSVVDNITMFAPDVRRQDIEQALQRVDLLQEIYRLPQGFATQLSAESPILSTGQRRRLILARALWRKPRLLLLDEVTANLDAHTEDKIVRALHDFPAAKVFVTHSERLLRQVQRVYAVRDGRLIETIAERPKISA